MAVLSHRDGSRLHGSRRHHDGSIPGLPRPGPGLQRKAREKPATCQGGEEDGRVEAAAAAPRSRHGAGRGRRASCGLPSRSPTRPARRARPVGLRLRRSGSRILCQFRPRPAGGCRRRPPRPRRGPGRAVATLGAPSGTKAASIRRRQEGRRDLCRDPTAARRGPCVGVLGAAAQAPEPPPPRPRGQPPEQPTAGWRRNGL